MESQDKSRCGRADCRYCGFGPVCRHQAPCIELCHDGTWVCHSYRKSEPVLRDVELNEAAAAAYLGLSLYRLRALTAKGEVPLKYLDSTSDEYIYSKNALSQWANASPPEDEPKQEPKEPTYGPITVDMVAEMLFKTRYSNCGWEDAAGDHDLARAVIRLMHAAYFGLVTPSVTSSDDDAWLKFVVECAKG